MITYADIERLAANPETTKDAWRAASLWDRQGQHSENGIAVWHEPKKPVLKHLGGRHYQVIEDGEPGHDW